MLCEWFLSVLCSASAQQPRGTRFPSHTQAEAMLVAQDGPFLAEREGIFWGRRGNSVSVNQSLGFLLARDGDGSVLWESVG